MSVLLEPVPKIPQPSPQHVEWDGEHSLGFTVEVIIAVPIPKWDESTFGNVLKQFHHAANPPDRRAA